MQKNIPLSSITNDPNLHSKIMRNIIFCKTAHLGYAPKLEDSKSSVLLLHQCADIRMRWDLNPGIFALQANPLNHFGTHPFHSYHTLIRFFSKPPLESNVVHF